MDERRIRRTFREGTVIGLFACDRFVAGRDVEEEGTSS
jgi:hypothetical protein